MTIPMPAPAPEAILERIGAAGDQSLLNTFVRIERAGVGMTPRGRYYHWDRLRHLTPPKGLTAEEWWLGVKMARRGVLRELPLTDAEGRAFRYCVPDEAQQLVHYIDQHASGEIKMPEVVIDTAGARNHYLVNSLIEESIRSSQLEGATTTYAVAKDMIRTGRQPKDRSERMILNNFRAMEFMLSEVGSGLTSEFVLELHRVITEGTLANPDAAGRLQRPDEERIVVGDRTDGSIVHRPPPAEQLPERLDRFCAFANGGSRGSGFLHPVVRAILLHFWLAYDHPFEDGNGRTARAIFYWSMATQGYWLTEYLSISRILRQAPARYMRSFLETETDEGDTTYFILHHLGVIKRAIEELHAYLQRKIQDIREVEDIIRGSDSFNYRQLALLSNSLRQPDQRYTFRSHALSHRVTHETARHDLLRLSRLGLLVRGKAGRQFVFRPALDLAQKLADHRASRIDMDTAAVTPIER